MIRSKLSDIQLADILLTLIGDIEPTGDSAVDKQRFSNLIKLQNTMDILLDEMYYICPCSKNIEYSMKEAGNTALAWFEEKRDWMNGFLGDDDDR